MSTSTSHLLHFRWSHQLKKLMMKRWTSSFSTSTTMMCARPTTSKPGSKRPGKAEMLCIQPFFIPRLEEASAPDSSFDRDLKSRSSGREAPSHAGEEEEKEDISDQDDDSTPPTFWRASENAVKATDLAEPATFQDTTSKPDQVHWRKAIRPELESMRFPVALCCQVDEQPTRYRDQLGAQD